MKQIFEYMNYREFLRDFYEERKRKNRYYSFRLFSEKAGFRAPNLLKLVMDGKRNLTKDSCFKFAKALSLNKRESEYFENLVFFNQCTLLDEKNTYLRALMRFRNRSDPRKIESGEYEYYSAWWHPVVRELVTATDFRDDYKRLGALVTPSISAAEAERSVALLERLGYIQRTDERRYVASTQSLTTGARVRSVAVANYHREMMKLASESIERFGSADRDISSLTLSVSEETCSQMVERLREFRRELLELAEADKKQARVVQLNLQLFPLSKTFSGKGGRT